MFFISILTKGANFIVSISYKKKKATMMNQYLPVFDCRYNCIFNIYTITLVTNLFCTQQN